MSPTEFLYEGARALIIPYAPDYAVTTDGHVISHTDNRPRKLTPSVNSAGYLTVGLVTEHGHRNKTVHRLVAEAFIPNPLGKPQVNHKDSDRKNPKADNLEWVTSAENKAHSLAGPHHQAMLAKNAARRELLKWLKFNQTIKGFTEPRALSMAEAGHPPHVIVKELAGVTLKKGYSKTLSQREKVAIRKAGYSYN